MTPKLRKAHKANVQATMGSYGYNTAMTELKILADLIKRYQKLTECEKR